jgi:hypothetical protein
MASFSEAKFKLSMLNKNDSAFVMLPATVILP